MDSDTDAAPDPDTDDRDIRARVAELEATVAQQQETISQLLPSRRRVLQAGGLVAGGGVLGALSADRASAQAAGQIGTSSDPVDVEAFDLAVQNQLSSNLDAGGNDLTNVGSLNANEAAITGLSFGSVTTKTISNDGISISNSESVIQLDGQSGSADDLDTISGGKSWQVVILEKGSNAITVTQNDNIVLDGSSTKTLSSSGDKLVLLQDDADFFLEIAGNV